MFLQELTDKDTGTEGLVRLPAWAKLVTCMGLSIAAFGAGSVEMILLLAALETVFLVLFCGIPQDIRKDLRMLVCQTVMITLIYCIRFRSIDAVWPGLLMSARLFLAFYPGIMFTRSVSQSQIVKTMTLIMPDRPAFIIATCMKFIPFMFHEIRSIYEMQVLRGARVLPKDLLRPWCWPDLVSCIMVPVIIRSMVISSEIALAAQARGFGMYDKRTCCELERGREQNTETGELSPPSGLPPST